MGTAWRAVSPSRWVPSGCLLLLGAGSVVGVVAANNSLWSSIWVGLAATGFSAGLVDLSAVTERRRLLLPVQRIAARRVGLLRQIVWRMIGACLDVHTGGDDLAPALRALPEAPIDLLAPAKVFPPRTRADYLRQLTKELSDVHDELMSFAASGIASEQLDQLDAVLRSSGFLSAMRDLPGAVPGLKSNKVLAADAAELVENVELATAQARTAAGDSWIYGN